MIGILLFFFLKPFTQILRQDSVWSRYFSLFFTWALACKWPLHVSACFKSTWCWPESAAFAFVVFWPTHKREDEFCCVFDEQLVWFERVPKGRRGVDVMAVKRFELSIVQTCRCEKSDCSHSLFPLLHFTFFFSMEAIKYFLCPVHPSHSHSSARSSFSGRPSPFSSPPSPLTFVDFFLPVLPVFRPLPESFPGVSCFLCRDALRSVAKRVPHAGLFTVHEGVLLSATLLCTG